MKKWFVVLIVLFATIVLPVMANEKNCHDMIDEWFGDIVEVYSADEVPEEEILDVISQYFKVRSESLYDQGLLDVEYLAENTLATENDRRAKIIDMQNNMNIEITDADSNIDINEIKKTESQYCVTAYEWVFYDYDDLDVEGYAVNVSGFGVEHTLFISPEFIITEDLYDESDLTGICTKEKSNDIHENVEVEMLDSEGEVELFAMYSGYNPDAAVAYSDKYVYNYNTAYYNFNSLGGDCANFTSQSIYAGGMPQVVGTNYGTDGWYYKSSSNRSATWTGATQLRIWMGNNRGVLINNPTASQIYKGSPVFYDWEGDGAWNHATICVGTNAEGSPIINSHNTDKYHEKWNYGGSSAKYSTVQLTNSASTPTTYSVIYDAQGGVGAPSTQTKIKDVTLKLSSTVPTKTGYTFDVWATTGGSNYSPGGSYTENSSRVLYAVWKANTYTVKYNANGGSGSMSASTHTYDTAKTLSANAFTRTGYTFLGWSTSSSATSIKYSNRESVKNLTSTKNGTVNLYAVWKANTYTVKYNANGGSGSMSASTHTYDTAKALSANAFTRTGYTFLGWSTSSSATSATYTNKQSVKNLTSTKDGTVNLYAVWKANTIPEKPVISVSKTTWYENETITFSWNECNNADYYYPMIHNEELNNRVEVCWGTENTGYSTKLAAGIYYLDVGAVNDSTSEVIYAEKVCITVKAVKVPGKPLLLNLKDVYTDGQEIVFSWEETVNTTHYNIYIDNLDGNSWTRYEGIHYATSGLTRELPAGEYKVLLQSTNSNYYTADGSTWLYTDGDWKEFTVEEETTELWFTKSKLSLAIGDTEEIFVTVLPVGVTADNRHDTLIWTSSNEDVAKVENGVIKAIGEGTAIIKCEPIDSIAGKFIPAECEVTVIDTTVRYSIKNTSYKTLTAGDFNEVCMALYDTNASEMRFVAPKYNGTGSDDTGILVYKYSHSDGGYEYEVNPNDVFYANSADYVKYVTFVPDINFVGEAEIHYLLRASDTEYVEGKIIIEVIEDENKKIDVTGVSLNKTALSMEIGEETTLVANVKPSDATNKSVVWECDNEDVVMVEDGVVTAVGEGKATVSVRTTDGDFTAECTITVTAPEEEITAPAIVTFSKAYGKQGDSVEIKLHLKTTEPVNSIGVFEISYDDTILSFEGFSDYEKMEDMSILPPTFDEETMSVIVALREDDLFDEDICTLVFSIREDAEENSVSYIEGEALVKLTSDEIESYVSAGSVTVRSQLLGDIDGDEKVNIDDAVLLFRYSMNSKLYPINYTGGVDFNNDGNVNIDDAVLLFRYSMNPGLYPIN